MADEPQQSHKRVPERENIGGLDWVVHLHETGAPPIPPPFPGPHSSSQHLPADHPRQTHYPSRPGSALPACHSPYVYISDRRGA